MSHLLPEFHRTLPESVQLDGELVALGEDGRAVPTSTASRLGCCTAVPALL